MLLEGFRRSVQVVAGLRAIKAECLLLDNYIVTGKYIVQVHCLFKYIVTDNCIVPGELNSSLSSG